MPTRVSQHTAAAYPANERAESSTGAFLDEAWQLLDQHLDVATFYGELLARATQPLGAANAAVWLAADGDVPSLVCQTGLEHEALFRNEATQQQHLRLIADVARDGRSRSVMMVAVSPEGQDHDLRNYVLHLQPVVVEGDVAAIIQIVRSEPRGSEASSQTPWPLVALAAIAASFHHLETVREKQQAARWMTQFERFVTSIHASLHPRQIACAIADNGPPLLDCERLVVLLRRGRRYRVVAVTGQSKVHPRANAVRCAERLLKSLPHVSPITFYPDDATTFAPRELEALETYLDETHAKSVAVGFFPVLHHGAATHSARKRKIYGGFIAEKYAGAFSAGAEAARVELLASHCAQAIHNASVHHRVFLLPLWSSLGWVADRLKTHVFKSLLLFLLVVGAALALIYVPADFDLVARGTVQPERRQHVFARLDGTIDELLVTEGQQVAEDEVLARLSNPELDLELEKIVGELRTTSEKLAAIKSSRLGERTSDRSVSSSERAELAAQEEELRQWIESLRRQQSLLEEQRRNLLVRAPLTGEVITWNVDPALRHRPVRRGQLLMTVADLKGPWGLELFLPDRHVGHFLEARERLEAPLDVEFTLATNPNQRIAGEINEAAKSIQVEEQQGASLLIAVEFDRDAVEFVQPGATVTAKIHCGRRPLGYVWLHDLWDFLQYRVFFRFD
jgi:multidrug efflux pump subunit AcrA (membrane-fusion protein)